MTDENFYAVSSTFLSVLLFGAGILLHVMRNSRKREDRNGNLAPMPNIIAMTGNAGQNLALISNTPPDALRHRFPPAA